MVLWPTTMRESGLAGAGSLTLNESMHCFHGSEGSCLAAQGKLRGGSLELLVVRSS